MEPEQKLTPETTENLRQNVSAIKRLYKKSQKQSRQESRLSLIFITVILLISASAVGVFAWIGFLIVFQPYQLGWVNGILPEWAQISLGAEEKPQTFQEIESKLIEQGKEAGNMLTLEDNNTKSFLLPVFQEDSHCESDCRRIVELRVYQSQEDSDSIEPEPSYRSVLQMPITGVEQSFVVAPLANVDNDNQGSSTNLPLTEVQQFKGSTTSSGIWLYLRGQRSFDNNAIAYGQILYYNPRQSKMQTMLSWTSPNGQLPQWQKLTGEATKELVINQTVGLEPQLQIYQLNPHKIELSEISLQTPALKDSAYENALSIARSGLWTPAFEWLEFIKKNQKVKLPDAAKAQIDFIRLHSQISKAQADKIWASPSQQVLADLIDGRWGKALKVFEASPQNALEITALLKADQGRLWNRVEAALQVNHHRPEVQAWGALILTAQHGQDHANTWLKQQPEIDKTSVAYIQTLLKQMTTATPNF